MPAVFANKVGVVWHLALTTCGCGQYALYIGQLPIQIFHCHYQTTSSTLSKISYCCRPLQSTFPMAATKTYFLAPDFDTPPPPDGPITLGNILLNSSDIAPINAYSLPDISGEKVFSTWKKNVKMFFSKEKDGKTGAFLTIFENSGLGGELSYEYSRASGDRYTIKQVDTTKFDPSPAFIKASMESTEVAAYMKSTKYKNPVFMITGLKVAVGACQESTSSTGRSFKSSLGVDGATFGAPGFKVGPHIEHSKDTTGEESFGESSDFVLAFRLRKMGYKKDKKTIEHELVTGGQLHGEQNKSSEEAGLHLEVDDGDAGLNAMLDLQDTEVDSTTTAIGQDEDGEDCVWIVPEW
jgi:hypothetical protein